MEPRNFLANAVAAPPDAPAVPSVGYPTDGNDLGGQGATWPGAYWFYQIGEELRRVIVSAGLTPDYTALDQLDLAINAKIEAAASQIPIGSTLIMDGDVVPYGFLKRNGAELLRASYPELWAYAQTVSNFISQATKDSDAEAFAGYYGDGDGSTTFTIPDWRGEFWRAWDDGRGVDVGRVIGSWQADEIEEHSHQYYRDAGIALSTAGGGSYPVAQSSSQTGTTGGIETRPRSLSGAALVRAY